MPGRDQTTIRDNMLARMAMATPGGPRWPTIKAFDEAQAYAAGKKAHRAIFGSPAPIPNVLGQDLATKATEVRAALERGERVVLTANGQELAIYEPEPGAVLAATMRRGYATAGRVTSAMLDAAQSFLPDVDREALRLTLEATLRVEHAQNTFEGHVK